MAEYNQEQDVPGIKSAGQSVNQEDLDEQVSDTRQFVIFVAGDEPGLLGFVLFDAQRQWLEQIAVSPRGQGGGVASQLIGCAKTACPQGFGLDVNADNFRALAFYRREGFVRTGEGKNPRSGLPIVILRWTPGRSAPEREKRLG